MEGGRGKEEGGRKKEEGGGRREEEGGRRKEEGGRRKEEGGRKGKSVTYHSLCVYRRIVLQQKFRHINPVFSCCQMQRSESILKQSK